MATLGYVRSTNGPDLAQVGVNEQLVSHVFPNTTGETLRITSVSAWVGHYGTSSAVIRLGIWAATSSSAAPGALLARTVEYTTEVRYSDGAGGKLVTLPLETPFDLAPGQVICLGIAARNNSAGIAMFEAQDISQPNENFYRKNITGTNLEPAAGSGATNQGHLAISVTGTTNQPPTAPTELTPSGAITGTLRPVLSLIHNDPNGDRSQSARVQVQTSDGATSMWVGDVDFNVADGARGNIGYNGSALNFYTMYRWRARTVDTSGATGTYSGWENFTIRHNNRAPNLPKDFSVSGEVSGSREIIMQATFTDPDLPVLPDGQAWEVFTAKQIIVRRVSDNSIMWDSGVVGTSTTEKANLRTSTPYTLPAWNTEYRWSERHRDRSGEWSDYASVNVLAKSGASVDLPSSPTGRVTNPANPGTVSAVYRNTGSINAQWWRVGLFNEHGTLIKQSPIFSPSGGVSPNSQMNASWSSTGFGTLENGTIYRVGVRVLVSPATGWSDWSPLSGFTTNAAPDTPTLWAPNADPRENLPGLSVRVNDPDQPPQDQTVTIEVYDDSDSLLSSVNAPHNTGHRHPNVYTVDVPTLTSIIPGYGTYRWRAQANDGFLNSPWSEMFELNYYPVPAVAITSPTGPTITTSQPQLVVSTDAHTHWRIVGRDDNDDIVYDTGERPGTLTTHTVSGTHYWIGGERWNNHETFHWTAMVRSAAGQWGSSDPVTLTLEYIPPAALTVQSVEPASYPGAKGSHYAVIVVSQPDVTEEAFIRTVVDRVEIDGPQGNEIPGTLEREHFVAGSTSETAFTDFDMTSNQWYRYQIRYEVQSGVDVVPSEPVYAEAMVSFHGVLLHMPFDPLNAWVWLPYGTERYSPEVEWHQGHHEVMTVNGRAPYGYSDSTDFVVWRHESVLVPREDMTTEQQRDAFRRLWKYQNARFAPNGRPNSVCFREGRGGDDGRVYGRISQPRRLHSYTRLYTVEFEFREQEEMPVEGGGL